MEIRIISDKITKQELQSLAEERYGDLVKAVVDIEKKIMAAGGELHADEEMILLEKGSKQKDLWGINLYPLETGEKFIEFDSVINIRPSQNNRSRGVEDSDLRKKITEIVNLIVI